MRKQDYKECQCLFWAIFALNIPLYAGSRLSVAITAFLQLICILLLGHYLKKLKD